MVSLELLAKGRQMADQMGWPLVGLLLGHQVSDLVTSAFTHGVDQVCLADFPLLETFTIDAYAHVVHQALIDAKPNIFLLGATPNGRDLAGRLAVRLRTGLNADCTGLYINPENGVLVSEVSGFGGGVLALIEMQSHRPQMATVRPGVFSVGEPDPTRGGELITLEVELSEEMVQTRILERVIGAGVDLTGVPVLVAGGRGVDGDFKMLKELADLLGGDIGATPSTCGRWFYRARTSNRADRRGMQPQGRYLLWHQRRFPFCGRRSRKRTWSSLLIQTLKRRSLSMPIIVLWGTSIRSSQN